MLHPYRLLHAERLQARREKVTALDISEHAIETAKRNITLNGFLHRVDFVVANAFDYLRENVEAGKSWDVVILDPPAFAKSRGAVKGACRGYKDINLNGMKLVRPGGFWSPPPARTTCRRNCSWKRFRKRLWTRKNIAPDRVARGRQRPPANQRR